MSWFGWKIAKWKKVSSDLIPQKAITRYFGVPSQIFTPDNNTKEVDYVGGEAIVQVTGINNLYAPVYLPHGAIITEAKVNGTISDVGKWYLERIAFDDITDDEIVCTGSMNTADTTPDANYSTVNNHKYIYLLVISNNSSLAVNDEIYGGGYVKYTWGG